MALLPAHTVTFSSAKLAVLIGGKVARIKVRRTNREELPGISVLRDAAAADLDAFPSNRGVLDLDMEVDPDLQHLITHDPDGFFTATDRDETLGFGAAHVRSRQCVLSELWVLPQHRGNGAGRALLERLLAYGDRSGAREFLAVAPTEGAIQSVLLDHGFLPMTPVYLFALTAEQAGRLAAALTRLLPGGDATADLVAHRGQAEVDRIDRVTRNITRAVDHTYWLRSLGLRAAFVRRGDRIVAYAYGGASQVGPVAGGTQEAALAALGWACRLALDAGMGELLWVRVPARFTGALEALRDVGARLEATLLVYGKGSTLAFDRSLFGPIALP